MKGTVIIDANELRRLATIADVRQFNQAADEIERLTAKIEVMRDALERIAGGAYREAEQAMIARYALDGFIIRPNT